MKYCRLIKMKETSETSDCSMKPLDGWLRQRPDRSDEVKDQLIDRI